MCVSTAASTRGSATRNAGRQLGSSWWHAAWGASPARIAEPAANPAASWHSLARPGGRPRGRRSQDATLFGRHSGESSEDARGGRGGARRTQTICMCISHFSATACGAVRAGYGPNTLRYIRYARWVTAIRRRPSGQKYRPPALAPAPWLALGRERRPMRRPKWK